MHRSRENSLSRARCNNMASVVTFYTGDVIDLSGFYFSQKYIKKDVFY